MGFNKWTDVLHHLLSVYLILVYFFHYMRLQLMVVYLELIVIIIHSCSGYYLIKLSIYPQIYYFCGIHIDERFPTLTYFSDCLIPDSKQILTIFKVIVY